MERAVDWLFSHPDAGSDDMEVSGAADTPAAEVEKDERPATYKLFALISHKGPSAQCGHYVAYVKKQDKWILYNDNKVVEVPDITSAAEDAYVYVYQRQ